MLITGDIAEKIGTETEKIMKSADPFKAPEGPGPAPFDIDVYRESFTEMGAEILPENLMEETLAELRKESYKIRQRFPEGSEVLLAVFPCDSNGLIYTPEEMKEHKYFKILFVNDVAGMATGYGSMAGTQYRFLPDEIRARCKFTVHYEAQADRMDHQKDFEDFSVSFKKAYGELHILLK